MASCPAVILLLPDLTVQGMPSFAGQGILLMGSPIRLEIPSDGLTPASLDFHPKSSLSPEVSEDHSTLSRCQQQPNSILGAAFTLHCSVFFSGSTEPLSQPFPTEPHSSWFPSSPWAVVSGHHRCPRTGHDAPVCGSTGRPAQCQTQSSRFN